MVVSHLHRRHGAAGTPAWDKWKADRTAANLPIIGRPIPTARVVITVIDDEENWGRCCPPVIIFHDERAHSARTHYIVFCFAFNIIGPSDIQLPQYQPGPPSPEVRTQSSPASPLLPLLFTASLCLPFQSRVKPPSTSSHTSRYPLCSQSDKISSTPGPYFLSEYVQNVLEVHAPTFTRSFLRREREEQEFAGVECDLSLSE